MGRFGLSEHEPKRLWELWGQGMAVQDVATAKLVYDAAK